MDTHDKRRLYSLVFKLTALFAVLLAFVLFVRGVFHKNPGAIAMPVERFSLEAIPERLQVLRWNGREVAVLPRTPAMLARLGQVVTDDTVRVADYYVFYNRSTSGARCPLNIVGTGESQRLTDICSKLDYDLSGEPLQSGVLPLDRPPYHIDSDGRLVLGQDE